MAHKALARKYRPRFFADLIGQQHVAAGLAGAVARNRAAHAYLLTGPRGVGKTTAARILAMALNCQERAESAGEPCGTCDSCSRIWSGTANLDVVEIDAASNRGVDDARDLRERAMYAASGPNQYKVYIVDEAHMLTREAWNTLLKILEEPPPRVVFVFATTEPQKIATRASPVLSRVQRFDFRRIAASAIRERLSHVVEVEGISAEEDALALIARVADGGMRDALSLLDQVVAFGEGDVSLARVSETVGLVGDDLYAELMEILAARRTGDVFPFVARVVEGGADIGGFVHGAGLMLRALLAVLIGGEPEVSGLLESALRKHQDAFKPGDVLRMIRLLSEAEGAIKSSPNARLYVETLLLQWTLLDRTVELQDLINRVGGRERAGEGPGAAGRLERGRGVESGAEVALPAPGGPPGSEVAKSKKSERSLTFDALVAAWEDVLENVGIERRMLREALGHTHPISLHDGELLLSVGNSEVHLGGLKRGAQQIAEAVRRVTGARVRVRLSAHEQAPSGTESRDAQRLDAGADKEERLKSYRSKDKALDAVAEALDLELTD